MKEIENGLVQFKSYPMMILWGARDFCFDKHFLKEWQWRFPGAEVHLLEDAGHYVIEDALEEIISLMHNFLD